LVAISIGPPTRQAVKDGFSHDKMIEYQKRVRDTLDAVRKNPIGKVVTDFVLQHRKRVTIEPFYKTKADDGAGMDNASASPASHPDSAPQGVSGRGPDFWYAGHGDKIHTLRHDEREDKAPPDMVGTGAGSDVVIYFSPEQIRAPRIWDRRADNVLVHELIHAIRSMQGLRNAIPTKNSDWMNEEEFWACVVQDVYLSAGGSTNLRYGYGDYERLLSPPLNTSSGFLAANLELFEKHSKSWGHVYTAIALVNTAIFNPFREFLGQKL
jgi:hypothetical protein